jgi:helix-turn-helix protein
MSESVIADFVAKFNSEATVRSEPVKGRIVLSEKRLVLAADAGKVTIPLTSVIDIGVGQVPDDLGGFFSATVTVAFERGDRNMVAAIEAGDEKIDKFSTVLFKAVLNGTNMTVKHPAKVGGRVTGEEFTPAKLFLKPQTVEFRRQDNTVAVKLATVDGFDRLNREIAGQSRPVLAVKHMPRGKDLTTFAAADSARKMNILGRYLRLEYTDLRSEIDDIELSESEIRVLVTIYSSGSDVSLAKVLDMDGSQVTMLLNDLENEDLVVNSEEGTQLTPKGRIVVSNHLENVNA